MLKKAKERIVLSELSIKDVKFRKGRTGATIMELDGEVETIKQTDSPKS